MAGAEDFPIYDIDGRVIGRVTLRREVVEVIEATPRGWALSYSTIGKPAKLSDFALHAVPVEPEEATHDRPAPNGGPIRLVTRNVHQEAVTRAEAILSQASEMATRADIGLPDRMAALGQAWATLALATASDKPKAQALPTHYTGE